MAIRLRRSVQARVLSHDANCDSKPKTDPRLLRRASQAANTQSMTEQLRLYTTQDCNDGACCRPVCGLSVCAWVARPPPPAQLTCDPPSCVAAHRARQRVPPVGVHPLTPLVHVVLKPLVARVTGFVAHRPAKLVRAAIAEVWADRRVAVDARQGSVSAYVRVFCARVCVGRRGRGGWVDALARASTRACTCTHANPLSQVQDWGSPCASQQGFRFQVTGPLQPSDTRPQALRQVSVSGRKTLATLLPTSPKLATHSSAHPAGAATEAAETSALRKVSGAGAGINGVRG